MLGNDLAGSKIWKQGPPLVYVGSALELPKEPEGCANESPKVFSTCAVTRARSKALSYSIASRYFLSDGLLFRKWARVVSGVQVDSVVQVVASPCLLVDQADILHRFQKG